MIRETFIAIVSATLAEANEELVAEAKNLLHARERQLLIEKVQEYEPGDTIEYYNRHGERDQGIIDHLNMFSVTVNKPNATEGYTPIVVRVDKIIGGRMMDLNF